MHDDLVAEQIAYYRARAEEYDRMLDREGRYSTDRLDGRSADADTRELALVEQALAEFQPTGDVLELACGTGWWTRRLASTARTVTGVDASPEMLALNRSRVDARNVALVNADLFEWQSERRFDVVFFSFWLSHVPRDRFAEFWSLVDRWLTDDGRVFLLDEAESDAMDGHEEDLDDVRGAAMRWLEDGRGFRMVKVYYQPDELESQLRGIGWEVAVRSAGRRVYYGVGRRTARSASSDECRPAT